MAERAEIVVDPRMGNAPTASRRFFKLVGLLALDTQTLPRRFVISEQYEVGETLAAIGARSVSPANASASS
ncbi:MAG: hypothetical protein WB808_06275 [Candidatus Dormiibacterota bacterium]